MNLPTVIYLTEFISNLGEACSIIVIIGLIIMLFCGIAFLFCLYEYVDRDGRFKQSYIFVLKKYWILLIPFVLILFIPTKNAMYLMLGAKYLSNSKLPGKVEKVISLKIDDYINELQEKSIVNKNKHDSSLKE